MLPMINAELNAYEICYAASVAAARCRGSIQTPATKRDPVFQQRGKSYTHSGVNRELVSCRLNFLRTHETGGAKTRLQSEAKKRSKIEQNFNNANTALPENHQIMPPVLPFVSVKNNDYALYTKILFTP